MNREELVHGLDLDDEGVFDQEIDDIHSCDLYPLVFEGQGDLAAMRDLSELQLAAQASVITGFQEARTQMAMYLDRRAEDLFANSVGGMLDEAHSRFRKNQKIGVAS